MKIIEKIIVFVLIAFLITGCANTLEEEALRLDIESEKVVKDNKEEIVIGLSVDQEFESRIGVTNAIKAKAKEKGYEVKESIADGDPQTQNVQIEKFVEEKVDAILVCAVDQTMVEEAVRQAKEENIPVIAFDRNLPDSQSIEAYVGPDSFADGQACGEAMIKALQMQENQTTIHVLELVGALNDQNGIERSRGWNNAVEKMPEIKVIQMPTDWDEDSAAEVTLRAFQSISDIKAVFCSTDSFVPYVTEVLEGLDMNYLVGEEGHIFINGVNGSIEGYEAVVANEIDGFAVMNLEEIGILAVELVEKILDGEEIERVHVVQSTYYTPETAVQHTQDIWGAI